jgi:hypothetical protein
MSACCNAARIRKTPSRARKLRETLAWILPGALLVFAPKCPACLAAYVALWTVLGLSMAMATHLRWAMLIVGVASLLFLVLERLNSRRAVLSFFKKERG